MSTIFFGLDDLANAIVVATRMDYSGDVRRKRIAALSALMAIYSALNCEAFKSAYWHRKDVHDKEPVPAFEIERRVTELSKVNPGGSFEHAVGFLRLASYNLDEYDFPEARYMLDGLRLAVLDRFDR